MMERLRAGAWIVADPTSCPYSPRCSDGLFSEVRFEKWPTGIYPPPHPGTTIRSSSRAPSLPPPESGPAFLRCLRRVGPGPYRTSSLRRSKKFVLPLDFVTVVVTFGRQWCCSVGVVTQGTRDRGRGSGGMSSSAATWLAWSLVTLSVVLLVGGIALALMTRSTATERLD